MYMHIYTGTRTLAVNRVTRKA